MPVAGLHTRGTRGVGRSQRGLSASASRGDPNSSSTITASSPSNNFESERIDNNRKRVQRGLSNNATSNGRGRRQDKHIQPGDMSAQKTSPFAQSKEIPSKNPFAPSPMSLSAQTIQSNPFAPTSSPNFPMSADPVKPFGTPSQGAPTSTTSIFSMPTSNGTKVDKSQNPAIAFGAPSLATSNPFQTTPASTLTYSNAPRQGPPSQKHASLTSAFPGASHGTYNSPAAINGADILGNAGQNLTALSKVVVVPPVLISTDTTENGNDTLQNGLLLPSATAALQMDKAKEPPFSSNSSSTTPKHTGHPFQPSPNSLTDRVIAQLKRDNVEAPSLNPLFENPEIAFDKAAISAMWNKFQDYRSKARKSLMSANLLDDPEKPKKLKDAIDFKGTCEEMCPQFEVVTRLMDQRYDNVEKDRLADGSTSRYVNPRRMIKALARSAAGQDAPLPDDIRSAAALRRTIDHLFITVLGERDLKAVHGFLWDRTRAVRRDFVFHSSMSPPELVDQVYCLERITRFHAIALHQMSVEGVSGEEFVEQQEREQLSKSLLSLMHAYEDCEAQGVHCENELEFKAYYILFNGEQPDILEIVQNWGWKYWGESEEIKIAISLADAIQNTWDIHGPLNPLSTTEIGLNAYARFFTIVKDSRVSYTMACFAEIYFNKVRKAIMRTILSSYRKQREQTRDWTSAKLNSYLNFDNEEEVEPFLHLYDLELEEAEDGSKYLSFESSSELQDPHPPPKQTHSNHIVERKRGDHSLTESISNTIYHESILDEVFKDGSELFVAESAAEPMPVHQPFVLDPNFVGEIAKSRNDLVKHPEGNKAVPAIENTTTPLSVFDRLGPPKSFSSNFFTTPCQPLANETSRSTPVTSSLMLNHIPIQTSELSSNNAQNGTASARSDISVSTQQPSQFATAAPSSSAPSPSLDQADVRNIDFTEYRKGHSTPTTEGAATPKISQLPSPLYSSPDSSSQTWSGVGSQIVQAQSSQHRQNLKPVTSLQSVSSQTLSGRVFSSAPSSAIKSPILAGTFESGQIQPQLVVEAQQTNKPALRYQKLTEWIVNGDDGLMDHFGSLQAERLLHYTFTTFLKEKEAQAEAEADKVSQEEAAGFRYYSLATRYSRLWRRQTQRLWLKRRGREARKARTEMAHSLHSLRVDESLNVVEDFKASTTTGRRNSLESLLNETGILNAVRGSDREAHAMLHEDGSSPKRQRSGKSLSSRASSASRHKRGKSENPLGRSLMSDSSYLKGGSRIHLLQKYSLEDKDRPQVSGVRTDYFRLKARGITTLPDGTALATSAAFHFPPPERCFDGSTKSAMIMPVESVLASKSPVTSVHQTRGAKRPLESESEIQALKERAKEILSEDRRIREKRNMVDDEELFYRAKRVREQMEEGASWFKQEVERETASRSVS